MTLLNTKGLLSLPLAFLLSPFATVSALAEGKPQIVIEWSSQNSLSTPSPPSGRAVRTSRIPASRGRAPRVLQRLEFKTEQEAKEALEYYKGLPGVLRAEENQIYWTQNNDPYYLNGSLWGMYSKDEPPVGPAGTTNEYGSQAEQGWQLGVLGDMRVVVGVIDTGVDYTHPDLYLNIYLNQGEIKTLSFFNSLTDSDGDSIITFRDLNHSSNSAFVSDVNLNGRIDAGDLLSDSRWENGVDNDNNGFTDDLVGWDFVNGDNDPFDDNEHGTHVAGTIGGLGGNSTGVAGVVWKAQIMPLKFLSSGGWGGLDDAVQAIDYYTSAASAQDRTTNPTSPLSFIGTNNSWGGGGYSSILEAAINDAAIANTHFVVAAGNSSQDNDDIPEYPTNYSTLSAAGWEAVTSVAALASNGGLAWFSSYGQQTVDIGAPGADIFSSVPGNGYDSFNGTSMATPHVMGTFAALASRNLSAPKRTLREIVLSSSVQTPSLLSKVSTNGRLDVKAALLSPFFSLSASTSQVNEGSSVTFTVSTLNVGNGTVLYWGISGIQASDISPPALTGSFTVNSDQASVTLLVTNDSSLEGPENLTFSVYSDSNRSTLVKSTTILVNDTSTGLNQIWGTTRSSSSVGTEGPDMISGVPSTGTSPSSLGYRQVDDVAGKGGADLFLLGQYRAGLPRVFYNYGVTSSTGSVDYMRILDFNPAQDKILFSAGRYFTRNFFADTVIYWDRNNNSILNVTGPTRDEIVAIVRKVRLGNQAISVDSKPAWAIFGNP